MVNPESRKTDSDSSAFFLVGPTAVGKTRLAQYIAESDDYDILSADAMLVYKGMDVGTDKPGAEERRSARYWGIDLAQPDKSFSVGAYMQHATQAIDTIRSKGGRILAVGGTGLYVKCLTQGLEHQCDVPSTLRRRFEALLEEGGTGALQEALKARDPGRFDALPDKENPRRLLRALEMSELGQEGPSGWATRKPPVLIGLKMEMSELYKKIEARVHHMYQAGLIEEVKQLIKQFGRLSRTASQAIGYREALLQIEGAVTPSEAKDQTIRRTRKLAKRQMTWFRNQANVCWIDVTHKPSIERLAEEIRKLWSTYGPCPIFH